MGSFLLYYHNTIDIKTAKSDFRGTTAPKYMDYFCGFGGIGGFKENHSKS